MKTRIGVTVRSTQVDSLYASYSVQTAYVEALKEANAEPVFLSPKPYDELREDIKTLDGLMIMGGKDVHPKFYGEENTDSDAETQEIDQLDIDAIRIALELKKEILGICRGLQIINVALGGTLHQHIEGHRSHSLTHAHSVTVVKDSLLDSLIKTNSFVNSFHHQSIKDLAPKLKATAFSSDGIIEAIEADGLLAVQWHPERMRSQDEYLHFFKAFIKRAQK